MFMKRTPFRPLYIKLLPSNVNSETCGVQHFNLTAHMNLLSQNTIHIVFPHLTLSSKSVGPVLDYGTLSTTFPHLMLVEGTSTPLECAEACRFGKRYVTDHISLRITIGSRTKVRGMCVPLYHTDGKFCLNSQCPGDRRKVRASGAQHTHGLLCYNLSSGGRIRQSCMFGHGHPDGDSESNAPSDLLSDVVSISGSE